MDYLFIVLHENQREDTLVHGTVPQSSKEKSSGVEIACYMCVLFQFHQQSSSPLSFLIIVFVCNSDTGAVTYLLILAVVTV